MRTARLQSAMEYLMTYSWAIVVAAIVIGVFFLLGAFNPGGIAGQQCNLPAGFTCVDYYIYPNGLLSINLLQVLTSPIYLTGIGCNTNTTLDNMVVYSDVTKVYMLVGENHTFNVQCYAGNSAASVATGNLYKGYVIYNYTELTSGLPHTVFGRIYVKATSG